MVNPTTEIKNKSPSVDVIETPAPKTEKKTETVNAKPTKKK